MYAILLHVYCSTSGLGTCNPLHVERSGADSRCCFSTDAPFSVEPGTNLQLMDCDRRKWTMLLDSMSKNTFYFISLKALIKSLCSYRQLYVITRPTEPRGTCVLAMSFVSGTERRNLQLKFVVHEEAHCSC